MEYLIYCPNAVPPTARRARLEHLCDTQVNNRFAKGSMAWDAKLDWSNATVRREKIQSYQMKSPKGKEVTIGRVLETLNHVLHTSVQQIYNHFPGDLEPDIRHYVAFYPTAPWWNFLERKRILEGFSVGNNCLKVHFTNIPHAEGYASKNQGKKFTIWPTWFRRSRDYRPITG